MSLHLQGVVVLYLILTEIGIGTWIHQVPTDALCLLQVMLDGVILVLVLGFKIRLMIKD